MPVCTVQLLSLDVRLSKFITALRKTPIKPLTIARVVRWIVKPTTLSSEPLLNQRWDVLLILPVNTSEPPPELHPMIRHSWSIQAGIPSKLISSYDDTNSKLLHPTPKDVPVLTTPTSELKYAESTQALELTQEFNGWVQNDEGPQGAVSMLNLLSFKPGKKEQYLNYGKAFAESAGRRRGGVAKLVGKVVPDTCSDGCKEWDEVRSPPST